MKIAIGADHRGFEMKEYLKQNLAPDENAIEWMDVGAYSSEQSDYPIFGMQVAQAIRDNRAERGILICGSGIGMAIVANRFPGIYAGLVWNVEVAQAGYQDDKINVLVLPADFVDNELACRMCHAWLTATFQGDRHQTRIDMIDELEL